MRRAIFLLLFSTTLCLPSSLFSQYVPERPGGKIQQGKFLVATELLKDPRFREKVVLIVEHDDNDGTLGLILNYSTKVPLSEAFPESDISRRSTEAVYVGGPVDMKRVFTLIRLHNNDEERKFEEIRKIFGDVYLAAGVEALEKIVPRLKPHEDLRVYIGYAGWAKGQLDFEMKTGHWLIWEADEAMIFNQNPATVWPEMFRRSNVLQTRLNTFGLH